MELLGLFLHPLVFVSIHLYTRVERSTVRVTHLAQENIAMSPAKAVTQTARSGVERSSHETTAPPKLTSS